MQGLSTAEAKARISQYGYNELTATNKHPWYKILWSQFTDILVIILVVAAIISGIHGEIVDMSIIILIIMLNAGIGFFQEYKTEKTLEALQKMIHPEIRVIRDGVEQKIATKELVPGDVIILGEGDKIPADGKLLEANSLRVEEAALTGESAPVDKKEDDMVYMGTGVAKGSGLVEIVHTGSATKFGEIAKLAVETKKVDSPLQKEIKNIGKFVAKVTLVLCVILFAISIYRDGLESIGSNLIYAVSIAIAAVPEGLPTTITIALALGATVLAKKMVIVKKLSSVETLGAVTTICSDKTGTLTKNEMTARKIVLADGETIEVTGAGYDPSAGSVATTKSSDMLALMASISYYCSEASLRKTDTTYTILGDPTEGALLTLAEKITPGINSKVRELDVSFPFDSDRKMMSVVYDGQVLVKGSPDQILTHCREVQIGGKVSKMTDAHMERIRASYTSMAEGALRVLALAYRPVKHTPKTENEAESELIFVGLIGIIDPPRPEAKVAVSQCKSAGIRVIVITGDYGITAGAIAKELGIIDDVTKNVYVGADVEKLSDAELRAILGKKESIIFSRSLPAQKMRIVGLLQELGEVVAMTGDGVNDAPALKKADIGIAMGITGTEVSKESATMILMDDSFSSIVNAVEEGRRIYQNLRKFIWYMFSSNVGELVTVVAPIILFIPNTLTAVLILCINLGTDILPAIAMGVGPADEENMKNPPRDPKARILNKQFVMSFALTGIAIGLCVIAIFVITLLRTGWTYGVIENGQWSYAVTAAFAGLVCIQMVNTFSAIAPTKSIFVTNYLRNPFHLIAVGISLLMVLAIVYIPFCNTIFRTTPLDLQEWLIIGFFCLVPMTFMELRKKFARHTLAH